MEISSNASNIQPYGLNNGTKVAYEKNGAANLSPPEVRANSQINKAEATDTLHPVEAASELAEARGQINKEQREKMVEKMNEFISNINRGVAFKVDEDSGRDIVTIYETKTGDVIRQIPDKEMLETLNRLADYSANTGLLDDTV
ncbi:MULTISPECIES: flagellar protein FlaG [unclassified Vibrio]|uniref:Flagellar protein FlaG n=1 Tax=Vibrio sp. HB236076 TaxID=3232307 RepID=A0AB39HIC9_9VIBR|nr:flagellar protein FlaG [Vibrio sp. HB161653]MDP5254808.1 flagellar protein FlaG [Vibrio sp. HB161653]